ncbi:MAG TPA: PEP-CTERM sorting domain-containing protein [Candidatus Acidoferrum sp.]|nr:PEP-CTERM sorting domain-containing protein [Candidatus Acidoferrum sp.]
MTKSILMRSTRWALVLAAALLGIGLTTVRADTFGVSGLFSNGPTDSSILGGSTITISGGAVTSVDIMVGIGTGVPSVIPFTSFSFIGINTSALPNEYALELTSGGNTMFFLFSLGSSTSLTGYTGGSICSDDSNCNGGDASILITAAGGAYDLTSGSVTAPEPGTFLLLGSGLAGLGFLYRKRLLANS